MKALQDTAEEQGVWSNTMTGTEAMDAYELCIRADAVFTASWLKEEAKRGKLVRQRNKRAKHTEKHIASADGCENAAESVDNGRWHNADRPKSPT